MIEKSEGTERTFVSSVSSCSKRSIDLGRQQIGKLFLTEPLVSIELGSNLRRITAEPSCLRAAKAESVEKIFITPELSLPEISDESPPPS